MTYYVNNHQMQQGERKPTQIKHENNQERTKSRQGGEQVFAEQAEKKANEKQRQQQ